MTWSYNPSIPNPPNSPSADVLKMQQNTNSISSLISVDHVGFNTANGGYHEQVSFSANQTAPGIGTGVAELFANNPSGTSQPFWQNATQVYPLIGTLGSSVGNNGNIQLNNSITFQWGQVSNPGGDGIVTFSTVFATVPFTIQLTLQRSNASQICTVRNGTVTSSQFTYDCSSSGSNILYWFAIGRV